MERRDLVEASETDEMEGWREMEVETRVLGVERMSS